MKFIVDRFEDDLAICENQETGGMEEIDVLLLPADVKEGDTIIYDEDLEEYLLDEEETEEREEEIDEKMDDLWE